MGIGSKPPVVEPEYKRRPRHFSELRNRFEPRKLPDEGSEFERFLTHLVKLVDCHPECIERNLRGLRMLSYAQLVDWSLCVIKWPWNKWEHFVRQGLAFRYRPSDFRPKLNNKWDDPDWIRALKASNYHRLSPCWIFPLKQYTPRQAHQTVLEELEERIKRIREEYGESDDESTQPNPPPSYPPTPPSPPVPPCFPFVGDPGPGAQHNTIGNPVTWLSLTPVFSAIYNTLDPRWDAIAYEIQVTTDVSFTAITHWDSGVVPLATPLAPFLRCPDIPYGGLALSTNTRYYWRIRFYTNEPSPVGSPVWSNVKHPVSFVTYPEEVFPEMDVFDGFSPLPSGETLKISGTFAGVPREIPLIITNNGTALLLLTDPSPYITISNTVNCTVFLIEIPTSAILPTNSTTFTLVMIPDSPGVWSFDISIPNNDSDENPYLISFGDTALPE